MKRYSKSALAVMARNCDALDITDENPMRFRNERYECVGFSTGVYGISAALFMSKKTGQYFYVGKRTMVLMTIM